MKKKIFIGIMSVLTAALLASCSNASFSIATAATVMEMEITESYDDADPFVNEKLIYISDNDENINIDASFRMAAGSGLLEIADNETKEIVWSKSWKDNADERFSFSLNGLSKDKEYVVRLTCTKVKNAKLILTSDSSFVKERERPRRPRRG